MPTYNPVDFHTVGLRRSPRLASQRQKKLHDKKLKHIGFITAMSPLEEALEHQEIFTFKEAMKKTTKQTLTRIWNIRSRIIRLGSIITTYPWMKFHIKNA